MNSKTTWFSKLFRGDAPAGLKIVPDTEDEEAAPARTDRHRDAPEAVTGSVAEGLYTRDAEFHQGAPCVSSSHVVPPPGQVADRSSRPLVPPLPPTPRTFLASASILTPATRPEVRERLSGSPQPSPAEAHQASASFPVADASRPVPEPTPGSRPRTERPLERFVLAENPLWPTKAGGNAASNAAASTPGAETPAASGPVLPEQASRQPSPAQSDTPANPRSSGPSTGTNLLSPLAAAVTPSYRKRPSLDPIPPLASELSPWHQRAFTDSPVTLPAKARPVRRILPPALSTPTPTQPSQPQPSPDPKDVPPPPAHTIDHPSAQASPDAVVDGATTIPLAPAPQIPAIPGLSRRWALLSQFEPSTTDPAPAARVLHPRIVERTPPFREDD